VYAEVAARPYPGNGAHRRRRKEDEIPWVLGFVLAASFAGLLSAAVRVGGLAELVVVVAAGIAGGMVGDYIAGMRSRGRG